MKLRHKITKLHLEAADALEQLEKDKAELVKCLKAITGPDESPSDHDTGRKLVTQHTPSDHKEET